MRKAPLTLILPVMAVCVLSCATREWGVFGGSLKKSYSGLHSTVTREVPDVKKAGDREAVAEKPVREERPGVVVGRVHEVNQAKNEVTVRQNRDVLMGSIVYVLLDDREIMMTVTFPMQSVFKCVLAPNYRNRIGEIRKDMTVFLKQ